jgi:hypothetical protein
MVSRVVVRVEFKPDDKWLVEERVLGQRDRIRLSVATLEI